MAAADLRDELTCPICLSIYTDPVSLPCGHNFCQGCIGKLLDTQEGSGGYSCPECRAEYQERPALQRNRVLCNIAERFLSTHPEQDGAGIFCTYCVHSRVPAAKSCLQCEISMCDVHLTAHNQSVEHVLTEPTASFINRKCSNHKKLLEYYCCEDGVCICVSCCLAGEHRGHRVELLNEASDKKKEKMRNVLEKLSTERGKPERGAQRLQECKREVEEKAAGETERVTALFRDIREQLDSLEKRLLSDISKQKEEISFQLRDLMQQLEIKKDEMSRKIHLIEELCNMADPLIVLQKQESDGADFCGTEGADKVPAVGDLDVDLISETLLTGLAGIVTGVNVTISGQDMLVHINPAGYKTPSISQQAGKLNISPTDSATDYRCDPVYGQEATDMFLDINTAGNVYVSRDRKSAYYSIMKDQCRPLTLKRFKVPQMLSTRSFSSGQHYWEVEGSESGSWGVGVAYPSIERVGEQSGIGENNKSWCLFRWWNNTYSVRHDKKNTELPHVPSCNRIRISLDYEAKRLSFYELSEPIRHLHTFTSSFTEPLHAAFSIVYDINAWVRIIS